MNNKSRDRVHGYLSFIDRIVNEDTVFLCPECNNPVEYEDFKS